MFNKLAQHLLITVCKNCRHNDNYKQREGWGGGRERERQTDRQTEKERGGEGGRERVSEQTSEVDLVDIGRSLVGQPLHKHEEGAGPPDCIGQWSYIAHS